MSKIKPHRIIAVTETTRVRTFSLGHRRALAVWRAFKLVLSFAAALALVGCNAAGDHGPTIAIDPAFSVEQQEAIVQSVDDWSVALGLPMQTLIGTCAGVDSCVPVVRNDALAGNRLGDTLCDPAHPEHDRITLMGAGTVFSGTPDEVRVEEFDFRTIATHELGHLLGAAGGGVDGHGHNALNQDTEHRVMAAHAVVGAALELSAADVDFVRAGRENGLGWEQ
jgi:hypothetical protein